jgi:hypothetical protein
MGDMVAARQCCLQNADDEVIEEASRAADQVEMTVRQRVE